MLTITYYKAIEDSVDGRGPNAHEIPFRRKEDAEEVAKTKFGHWGRIAGPYTMNVFESVEDYEGNTREKLLASAKAKLTPAELDALGLSGPEED